MTPSDIISAREGLGLTQEELAIRAGISTQSVSRLERGVPVRPDTLKAVCAALDMSYAPMAHIEVVGPEDLVRHSSTGDFLRAAQTLPGVRYLVRVSEREWIDGMRAIDQWAPWLNQVSFEVGGLFGKAFMALVTTLFMGAILLVMLAATHNNESWISTYFVITICALGWIALIISELPLHYIIRYNSLIEHRIFAYAFADETMWVLGLDGDDVHSLRYDMTDGCIDIIPWQGKNLLIVPLYDNCYRTEVVPNVPGLVSLIKRPKSKDTHGVVHIRGRMPA